jgi:galactose mutarotase-like enzyme
MAGADALQTVTIGSPQLQATFVPHAGMVCSSLRHDGAELLDRRAGVRAYAQHGSTMGIPLLYPWANRLAALRYPGPHGDVQLARENALLKFDPNGLPIHGAIPGALAWELLGEPAAGASELRAQLRWQRPQLLEIFPFAHVLEVRARIDGATLTIETSVDAPADAPVPVPVSFGYHPYLTLPGSDRRAWEVELPATRHLLLDDRMIPTGVAEPLERHRFQLGEDSFDDAYAGLRHPAVFAVSAGARRIELQLREGYSFAQLYAPAGESFVCFEPMTAPTNALISRDALPVVEAGGGFAAAFAIAVTA